MNIYNPLFQYNYLYPLIILMMITIFSLYKRNEGFYLNNSIIVNQFDLYLFALWLFIAVNTFLNLPQRMFSDLYLIIIYPLLYLAVRLLSEKSIIQLFKLAIVVAVSDIVLGIFQAANIIQSSTGFKVTGSFSSPAVYTDYLVSIFPFLFYILYKDESTNKFLRVTSLIIPISAMVLILFFTMSRLAWLVLILIVVCILLVEFPGTFRIIKSKKYLIPVFFILSGALFIYLLQIKPDSTSGRFFVIKNTIQLFKIHLVKGIGIGNFDIYYNDFQGKYFLTHSDKIYENLASYIVTCYNDYLQFFLEGGILGIILFVFFSVKLILVIRGNWGKDNSSVYRASLISCTVVLILAMFSFPFHLGSVTTGFVISLGIIGAKDKEVVFCNRKNFKIFLRIYQLAIVLLFFRALVSYNAIVKWTAVTNQSHRKNVSSGRIDMLYEKLLPELGNQPEFRLEYARKLYIDQKYPKAVEILQYATKYSSNYDIFLLMGMCYEKMNKIELAEASYLKCSYMIPGMYISKYNLMMLYYTKNDLVKANEWALRISEMPVKIKSDIILKIKKTAYLIHKNYLNIENAH